MIIQDFSVVRFVVFDEGVDRLANCLKAAIIAASSISISGSVRSDHGSYY
jgi:hypothetical protein